MNHVLSWAREQGHQVQMLTLTSRHTLADDLSVQLRKMKRALDKMRQRRDWRRLRSESLVTHGRNGWHVHFHMILVLRSGAGDRLLELQPAWLRSLEAVGLSGKGRYAFHVQDAHQVGEYVTKWGAAEEMVLSNVKKGGNGGRNPFQLLRDFTFDRDLQAGELFKHFAKVFKGTRQLVWSNGLKDLAGVDEIDDGEAAAGEDQTLDEMVALIDHAQWIGDESRKGVRTRRVRVLEAAERSAEEARIEIAIGLPDDEPEDATVLDDDIDISQRFMLNSSKPVLETVPEHTENHTVQESEHVPKFKSGSEGSITF
jgi:hypothetical protein